jgi:valyl-tRNA synthetase
MHLEDYDSHGAPAELPSPSLADRWIESRLQRVIKRVEGTLHEYKFNELAHELYQFIWHELCDWYLELIKPALSEHGTSGAKSAAQRTMLDVLTASLQLLHPVMPFITEEIWHKLPGAKGSLMVSSYPRCNPEKSDEDAEGQMALIIDVVNSVRNVRWEMNVPPAQKVEVILASKNARSREVLSQHRVYVENLARAERITVVEQVEKPESAATAVAQDVEIVMPLKGIIDFAEEERRLKKEINKLEKDLATVTRKLSSEDFLRKAPPDIIEKEKSKAQEVTEKREKLLTSLNRLYKLISE